jgi:radical SAM superfamily enzyme YgiQ (UPF0313 family)
LAILSTICEQEQINYSCVDISLLIWQQLQDIFIEIDDFCITQNISPEVCHRLENLLDLTVKDIINQFPDTVFGVSLLSVWSRPVAEMFCKSVKKISQCEILLGGQGLTDPIWTDKLKSEKLIDHFIVGEAEITFRQFLQGIRCAPGINNYNFEQIDDLDKHCVIPNYSKLPINQYPYLSERPDFFITASRGCVRNCGYCDIGHQWKKYKYRGAINVAQEMIAQYERHGIRDFFFTDSLINGNMKMLNELCEILIDYKQQNPQADFKWRGQYIFRPKSVVNEKHIKRMAEAGIDYLIIGLETGSDRVRYDMNKKHTTDDAEWFLEMFNKYGIQCRLLMITGWVSETIDDHQDTLNLFSRWQKFVATETITGIELGSILMILEHSPIGRRADELEMSYINDKPYLWKSNLYPELDIYERVRRRIETHKEAIKYKWPITRSLYRLNTIKQNLLEAVKDTQKTVKSSKIIPINSR